MRLRALIGLLALVLIVTGGSYSHAQERVALVIGNSDYRNAEILPNPVRDAAAIGAALERLGFDVQVALDLDQLAMRQTLRDFGLKAESADAALVFYAGHGIEVGGNNFLLPVDARLARERDLLYEALPLDLVLDEVAQARSLGLVILDACRDNPLAEELRRALGPVRSRQVGQGLARVDALPGDTMVALSTKPGEVAIDGAGELSPYTTALLEHLEQPGLELNLLFRKVRDTVLANTAYRQDPRTYDALSAEPFYFKEEKPNQRPKLPQLVRLEILDNAGATGLAIDPPSDPDGDPLTAQVAGLPEQGTVNVGNRTLLLGDVLTIEQLQTATYTPTLGGVGNAGSFDFVVKDDRGGTVIGRLPIAVEQSNKAPVLQTAQALRLPSIPLNIPPPVDPDGDPLTISVAEVPQVGAVKSGTRTVAVGDQLSAEQLAALVLEPATQGALGRFAFKVTDPSGASATSGLDINIPGIGGARATATAPVTPTPSPATAAPPVQTARPPAAPTPSAVTPRPAETQVAAADPDEMTRTVLPDQETLRTSNIRTGPSAQTERVTTVPAGTALKVLGMAEGRNWFQVETPEGDRGYIFAQLVRPRPKQPDSPQTPASQAPASQPPAAAVQPVVLPSAPQAGQVAGTADCPGCPEMVTIPPGRFIMGDERGHYTEKPAHRVTIGKAFALAKYEVTVGQWQACVNAGGCRHQPDMRGVTDTSPVHNVSWNDAADFVAWLRATTGKPYRLPSEAEWEYAARGGTTTSYWWGAAVGAGQANCENCGGQWDRATPAAVGSFAANPFGLHDMNGGVMEWVADCWTQSHTGAPADGSARTGGNCAQHVLRGGSWRNDASYATSSSRLSYDSSVRYYTNGFRVALDLN